MWATRRVHVPLARGSVIPDIASMREDFPALCQPMAAIAGISTSTSTLERGSVTSNREPEGRYAPNVAHASEEVEHLPPSSGMLRI